MFRRSRNNCQSKNCTFFFEYWGRSFGRSSTIWVWQIIIIMHPLKWWFIMEPNPGTELSISRTLFFKEPKQLNLKSLWLQSMWDVCGSKKSTEVTTEVTRFSRIDFPAVTVTYNTVFKAFFFLLLLLNWLGNLKIWKSAKKKWRKKTAKVISSSWSYHLLVCLLGF